MADLTIRLIESEPYDFDCGKVGINDMVRDAYQSTLLQFAYAYEVLYDTTIVGYYMITFKKIDLANMPDEFTEYSSNLENCFSLHLRFITINKPFQQKGLGKLVMGIFLSEANELIKRVPIRIVTLDATPDNVKWYTQYGFKEFDYDPPTKNGYIVQMYKDLWTDKNRKLEEDYRNSLC